jgi:Ion channel
MTSSSKNRDPGDVAKLGSRVKSKVSTGVFNRFLTRSRSKTPSWHAKRGAQVYLALIISFGCFYFWQCEEGLVYNIRPSDEVRQQIDESREGAQLAFGNSQDCELYGLPAFVNDRRVEVAFECRSAISGLTESSRANNWSSDATSSELVVTIGATLVEAENGCVNPQIEPPTKEDSALWDEKIQGFVSKSLEEWRVQRFILTTCDDPANEKAAELLTKSRASVSGQIRGFWPSVGLSGYFSFTAITTLGFGDLAPSSAWTRLASVVEATLGILVVGWVLQGLWGHAYGDEDHEPASQTEMQREPSTTEILEQLEAVSKEVKELRSMLKDRRPSLWNAIEKWFLS